MTRAAALAVVASAVCACSAARIAGGTTVPSADAVTGDVLRTWTVADCRDAAGAPFSLGDDLVKLVRKSSGRLVLVDERPAYETLLVTNAHGERHGRGAVSASPSDSTGDGVRVFQLALKSASSAPYLREYRIPQRGPGRLVIVGKDWDSRDTADGFVAWYRKPAIACTLYDVASNAGYQQGPHTE